MVDFEPVLLGVRALTYFLTFFIIASFKAQGLRWRWGVSLFAFGLAGSSLAFAVLIATDWPHNLYMGPQWVPTVYSLCVFALVARCRGNLANLLPRFKRRTPPSTGSAS